LKFARKEKKRLDSPAKSKNPPKAEESRTKDSIPTESQPSLRRLSLRLENKADSGDIGQPLRRLSMKLEERMENNKTKPITLSKTEELKEFIRRESIKAGSILPFTDEKDKINPLNTPTAEVDSATPTIPKEELTSIIRRESIRLLTQSNSNHSFNNSMKEEEKNETTSNTSSPLIGRSLPKLKTRSSILLSGAKLNMKINTEEIPLSINHENMESSSISSSQSQKEDHINEDDVKHMESLINRFSSNQIRKKSILHTSYHHPQSVVTQNDNREEQEERHFPIASSSLKGIFEQNELYETHQPQFSQNRQVDEEQRHNHESSTRKEDFSFMTQEKRRPSLDSHHSTQPIHAEHHNQQVPDISFNNFFPTASSSRRSFNVHDEGVSIELASGLPPSAPIVKAPSVSIEPDHHVNVEKKPIMSVNHPEVRSAHQPFHVVVPTETHRDVVNSHNHHRGQEEYLEERKAVPLFTSSVSSSVDTSAGVSCAKNMLSRASKPPRAGMQQQQPSTQPTMIQQTGSNYSTEHHPAIPTNFQSSLFQNQHQHQYQPSQSNGNSSFHDMNLSSSQKPFHRSTTTPSSTSVPISQQPTHPVSHYSTSQSAPFSPTLVPLPVSDEDLILISKKDLNSIKEQLLKTEEKLTSRRQQQTTEDSNMFPYYPFEGRESTHKMTEKEPENDQQTSITSTSTQQELKEKLYENLTNANISSVRLSSATSAAKYLIKSLNHFQTTGNLHPYESDG
jgi:hypothetical protein